MKSAVRDLGFRCACTLAARTGWSHFGVRRVRRYQSRRSCDGGHGEVWDGFGGYRSYGRGAEVTEMGAEFMET